MNITFDELETLGYESVTDFCRDLMKTRISKEEPVYVYRGDMLCLTVDIEKAAKLQPSSVGFEKYRGGRKLKGLYKPGSAPLVRLND